MGCGNYWTSPFQVGSHHIAKGFADHGWNVGFLSAPISPLHILNGVNQELRDRWSLYLSGGRVEYGGKIWTYVPGALATPHNKILLRSLWMQRNWYSLSFPPVLEKLKQHGFDSVDILYLDFFNHPYLLDCIKYKKSIFRIADKSSGFVNSTRAAIDVEKEIASRVDLVLYTARSLEEHVMSLSPKRAIYFPNGVNFRHFADGSKLMPPEYEHIKRPIALYVGAMAEWFDFDLINVSAQQLPDISFVLIGPDGLAKQRLKKLPNIHILGVRKYANLPAYIHNADVGLIPFDIENHADLVNSINPLKLYEYMACGLPVVAVKWEELTMLQSPAVLCGTPDDFAAAIVDACAQGRAYKEIYQAYAHQHDWGIQVEALM